MVHCYSSVSSGSDDGRATHLINDGDSAALIFKVEYVLNIELLATAARFVIFGAAIILAFGRLATFLRLFLLFATPLFFAMGFILVTFTFIFVPWLA